MSCRVPAGSAKSREVTEEVNVKESLSTAEVFESRTVTSAEGKCYWFWRAFIFTNKELTNPHFSILHTVQLDVTDKKSKIHIRAKTENILLLVAVHGSKTSVLISSL